MKRNLLAGFGLAGALTLFTGIAAAAEPDEADPGAALLVQADQKVDQTVAGIETCATAKLILLRSTPAPTGVSADAWSEAVEQAKAKVETLVDGAGQQIETASESFNTSVETAAENGKQLPTLDTLTASLIKIWDPAHPAAGVCAQINLVTPTVGTPKVEPPSTKGTDEQGDKESEHQDKDKSDKQDKQDKPDKPETQHHDSGSQDGSGD